MATTEVSDILTISECLKEANVYGVKVPGNVSLLCKIYRDILSSRPAHHLIMDFKFANYFCVAMQATRGG